MQACHSKDHVEIIFQRAVSIEVSSKSCSQAVMGKCANLRMATGWRRIRRFRVVSMGHLVLAHLAVVRPLPGTKELHRPDILHLFIISIERSQSCDLVLTGCIRVFRSCGRRCLSLRSLALGPTVGLLLVTTITIVKLLCWTVSTSATTIL